MKKTIEAKTCRISSSTNLINVLDLGEQTLTGVFPRSRSTAITSGPLQLVWCPESGLLQLRHSYDLGEMYGDNYGYRSGLNASMVRHLTRKIDLLCQRYPVESGEGVLDIGSNDATTLKAYSVPGLVRVGMDPTGAKFREYYTKDIQLIPDFFSARLFAETFGGLRPKIITSIAMFYDLEEPAAFVRDIATILHPQGVWHFEQSYMPAMLRTNSYDTVCHEHLEYYSLTVVKALLEKCGLCVIDVEMNAVNGGSFAVTAARPDSGHRANRAVVDFVIAQEKRMGLDTVTPYQQFAERVKHHRFQLRDLIERLQADGKKIAGYGASTKGNVLLQFCGLGASHLTCIADVNPEKHGAFTPGTGIPIVSEEQAHATNPDFYLVLPWHFRDGILAREEKFRARGGKFIFPLPEIEIV